MTTIPRVKAKKRPGRIPNPDRHAYFLSDFAPELLTRVKIYAKSKRIPYYRVIEHLVTIGFKVISENPSKYDIRIFPEDMQKPEAPPK